MMLRLAITVSALITVAGLIACGGPDGTPTDLDGSDLDGTTSGLLERIPKDEVVNRCYGLGGDIYSYDFTYDYIEDRYLDRNSNRASRRGEVSGLAAGLAATDGPYEDPAVRGDWHRENYLRWSPDGSRVLFDVSEEQYFGLVDLYSVSADGSGLRNITDAWDRDPVWRHGSTMTYFDVSPDGSRIVYSICALTEVIEPKILERRWVYEYEIVMSKVDGTEVKRLTDNTHFDNFPVWSPDGTGIAFISDLHGPSRRFPYLHTERLLSVYSLATEESRIIVPFADGGVAPHPPAWSPDGQSIAFVLEEPEGPSSQSR